MASQSVARDTVGQQSPSGIHEEERDEDFDALNEVVMAVDLRDYGTVGCAYYVAREETMYFMEDAKLGGKEMIELRKFY
jgi:DNA mismatch repair protein MSH5